MAKHKTLTAKEKREAMMDDKGYIKAGSVQTYVDDFLQKLSHVKGDYVEYAADNMDWQPSSVKQDAMNRFLHYNMFAACIEPLQRGISPMNIAETLVMYKVMGAVNKDFKASFKQTVGNILYPLAKANLNQEDDKKRKITEALGKMSNNGRIPYDSESAVLQKIAIDRKYYQDVRQAGADKDKLGMQYNMAIDVLKRNAEADGVTPEMFSQQENVTIGMLIKSNPDYKAMYSDFVSEGAEMSPEKSQVRYIKTEDGMDTIQVPVWDGSFVDRSGDVKHDSFTPRNPMTMQEHMDSLKSAYDHELDSNCTSVHDFSNINVKDINQMHVRAMSEDGMSDSDKQLVGMAAVYSATVDWCRQNPSPETDAYLRQYTQEAAKSRYWSRLQETFGFDGPSSDKDRGCEFDDDFGQTDDFDDQYNV